MELCRHLKCGTCGRSIQVRSDGTFREHNIRQRGKEKCPGSRQASGQRDLRRPGSDQRGMFGRVRP